MTSHASPTEAEAHLALARAFFGAFARRDLDAVRACLAADVVWRVPGRSAISGDAHGPDGVLGYFGRLRELTGGTWKAEPLDLLAGQTGVVVIARGSGQRADGRAFDATYCLRLRMEGAHIVEARLYPEDLRAFEAFWA